MGCQGVGLTCYRSAESELLSYNCCVVSAAMWKAERKEKVLLEIFENAPKTLGRKYLKQLYSALFEYAIERNKDVDAMANSLLMMVLDDSVPALDKYLAFVILQKMAPITGVSEVLNTGTIPQLISALPLLLVQGSNDLQTDDVIKKLFWYLGENNTDVESRKLILAFLSRVVISPCSPLKHDDVKHILNLTPEWIRSVILPSHSKKVSQLTRSSSTLSVVDIGTFDAQNFLTILNHAQTSSEEHFLNIQVFSMLRSWLLSTNQNSTKSDQNHSAVLSDLVSQELSYTVSEYCLKIIDQVEKRMLSHNAVEFQKACLVEAISLLDVLCCADSTILHSVLPVIRRIYDKIMYHVSGKAEVQDVAMLVAAMQFFINHSSSVMSKADCFYPSVFCDLLDTCYSDEFAAFEVISLTKDNLAHLCYHSSILEKYFPTFFKVLAWRPTTFLDDFLQLLPAFMSQQTSVEIFHTLLDLPCLTAMLIISNSQVNRSKDKSPLDSTISEILKTTDLHLVFNFVLRRTSGIGDTFDLVGVFHQSIMPLVDHPRVVACSKVVIPLFKCYFSTFLQYADTPVAVLLIPALLERLSLILPVQGYASEVQKILANAIVQLLHQYPESVFHCEKDIALYISNFKNYSLAEQCFINLVWVIGEYTSVEHSSLFKPEIVLQYFEPLESTTYEIVLTLSRTSDCVFLKLLSVCSTTLAKLAARRQDLLPRAVLCIGKASQQLASFHVDHKKEWKIVKERLVELLAILNTPNVASIVLSPPKDLESGRLHRDGDSLPNVLRTVTKILNVE